MTRKNSAMAIRKDSLMKSVERRADQMTLAIASMFYACGVEIYTAGDVAEIARVMLTAHRRQKLMRALDNSCLRQARKEAAMAKKAKKSKKKKQKGC